MRVAVTLEILEETVSSLELSGYHTAFMQATPNRAMEVFDDLRRIRPHSDFVIEDIAKGFALAVAENQYEGLEVIRDAIRNYHPYVQKLYMELEKDVRRRLFIVYIGVQINNRLRAADAHVAARNQEAVERHASLSNEPAEQPRRLRLRGPNRKTPFQAW